jgi:hypothetical protein
VKLIGLEKDAKVCRLLIFTGEQLPMEIVVRNRVMKFTLAREELDKHRAHRASKGSFLPKKAVLNC